MSSGRHGRKEFSGDGSGATENACRRCKTAMRGTSGRGRYFRVDGERIELPSDWFVLQCRTCGRISLSIQQFAGLRDWMDGR